MGLCSLEAACGIRLKVGVEFAEGVYQCAWLGA